MCLHFGPGKLTPQEYYQFRLFDDSRYSPDAKRCFLGLKAQKQLYTQHIPMHWRATVGDKVVFYALFAGLGFPIPHTAALLHPSRSLGEARTLRDNAALESYLRDTANYPFFGKPVGGMYSLGVALATTYDAGSDSILLHDNRRIPVNAFVASASENFPKGYLLQTPLASHPALASYTDNRASTVRLMVFLGDDGPEIFRALWKIPGRGNIADNFWRDGNMLAALDTESGHVRRAVRGTGPDQEVLEKHPETGERFIGFALPLWQSVIELCRSAAAALPGIPLQAWDIAICPNGPVLVEANIGGDLNLPQIATGNGIMDQRLFAFLRSRR